MSLAIPLIVAVLIGVGLGVVVNIGVFDSDGDEGPEYASITPTSPPDGGDRPEPGEGESGDGGPTKAEVSVELIELELLAMPASATFWLDGEQVEGNPARISRPLSETPLQLQVKAEGYRTEERAVNFSKTEHLSFVLHQDEDDRGRGASEGSSRGDAPRKNRPPPRQIPIITEID
jgi:hypothetical protein